ncbi:MAG: CBS domain-containing protein, partial [Gammaproteobacteria bacterium]|nr:CBS domain-containing protein [Gammaproteobacteria bacterium]
AALMREHHVGDLVVVEEQADGKRPVGIVTDRDLVLEVLAAQVDMQTVTAGDIMSWELVHASATDGIQEVIDIMRTNGVRRLPLTDAKGLLFGIVTVDDIIAWLADSLQGLGTIIARERDIERARRTRA